MSRTIFFSILFIQSFLLSSHNNIEIGNNTVNSIIGDISYVEKFGISPTSLTDEDIRLATHLEYVEQKLREAHISHLSSDLKNNRTQLLNYLNDYINQGKYPRNYVNPEHRQSVFIDKKGRICAVGYLIERSISRAKAEEINEEYKLSNILDIDNESFDKWIIKSGFTKKELATIQPGYGPVPEPETEPVDKAYDVSTSILIGMNTTLSFVNASQAIRGDGNRTFPIVGLISGTGQLVLGIVNYPENNSVNKRERELSLLNIGFGTLTIALSSYNLFKIKENNEKSYAVRLKNFSLPQNNSGVGLSFSKRF